MAAKYREILERKFPDSVVVDLETYFNSEEHNNAASWNQSCDIFSSELDQAKDDLISCQNPI